MGKSESLLKERNQKTFEDVLISIKPFGLFQILLIIFNIYCQIFGTLATLSIIFYQISPEHTCKLDVEGWEDLGWSIEQKRNFTAPIIDEKTGELDKCHFYNISNYDSIINNNNDFEDALENRLEVSPNDTVQCKNWDYDRREMHETVVTEWNLVCEGKWMMEHGTSLNFLGMLFGSLVSGFLSDRFGRKLVILLSAGIMTISGVALSFVPTYNYFMIGRFIVSGANISLALVLFCYTFEFLTGKPRSIIGGLYFIPYAVTYSAMAGIAWLTRDWRIFNAVCTAPAIIIVFLWPILPESPRWLLAKGRVEEARKVLERAAKINGAKMTHVDLEEIAENLNVDEGSEKQSTSILTMFKYKNLVFRTFILFAIWIINVLVYYGLALNVSSFSGDVFVNNALAGAPVEVPAYIILTILLMVGRKPAGYLSLFFCGLCLVITIWLSEGTIKTMFGLAGKLGVTISFGVIYVHTTELFPTMIRNTGLSLSSAVSRTGSMIAPYISALGKLGAAYEFLPLVIFGVFAIAGGAFTVLLPETLGKRMPETMDEAANLKIFARAEKPEEAETEMEQLNKSEKV